MDVTCVSIGVSTRAPTGQTNAYVVGSDPAVLVDPAARTAELDDALADRRVEHVVATHTHPDHVGAVDAYAARFDATVWARDGRERRFLDATGVEPDETYRDGTVVGAEPAGTTAADAQTGLEVIDTPGHAPDHVAFAVDDAVICGDLAIAEGSVVVGHPEGDLRAYLTSLRRIHARAPSTLHPGHGPTIEEPRQTCERLLRHRLHREERVLAAVAAGATSIPGIVDAAYEKDVSHVRDLAEATVRAHVEKLAYEGRLTWGEDEITLRD